jgi:hypothetical protein
VQIFLDRPYWSIKNIECVIIVLTSNINGIPNDNRIENLCLLCPNCHSQTKTWGNKKRNSCISRCKICGNITKGFGSICSGCNGKKTRKFEISKEDLQSLVNTTPFNKIGKMFNVTGNTIRKRCKRLGVDI